MGLSLTTLKLYLRSRNLSTTFLYFYLLIFSQSLRASVNLIIPPFKADVNNFFSWIFSQVFHMKHSGKRVCLWFSSQAVKKISFVNIFTNFAPGARERAPPCELFHKFSQIKSVKNAMAGYLTDTVLPHTGSVSFFHSIFSLHFYYTTLLDFVNPFVVKIFLPCSVHLHFQGLWSIFALLRL